ncbi:TPA: hypothetical protein ACJX75_000063 [Pseudomonas aeruginosa]
MVLLRFLGLLFVLVSLFAGSAALVVLLLSALRCWPLLVAFGLTLVLLQRFMRRTGVRITRNT